MEWRETGILLSVRRHGEHSVIAEALTRGQGRHAGLVRGGAGRRFAATLQPGNLLDLTWRGRVADQLGSYAPELIESRAAALLGAREALAIFDSARALLHAFLPEREAIPALHDGTEALMATLDEPAARRGAYLQWEGLLLAELGFGLRLDRCAVTGRGDALRYVSPRSGHAVSAEAGAPYAAKLLAYPVAMVSQERACDPAAFAAAMRVTGHFLERWAGQPVGLKTLPAARGRLESLVARSMPAA